MGLGALIKVLEWMERKFAYLPKACRRPRFVGGKMIAESLLHVSRRRRASMAVVVGALGASALFSLLRRR